ncbi:MAG: FAD-dependent oxidoreductase, partial [Acidobacteriota bacterium]|nr:FAD-dependent oxidoreductase [Acidobacteriota bacterium]
PQWRVIKGGSREYVRKLVAGHRDRIRLNSPVRSVRRVGAQVEIRAGAAGPERFDYVFLACHSDQALAMLDDPTPGELDVLGAIRYQSNDVALHTEASQMPRSKRAWSSWNYRIPTDPRRGATVTYYMNALQSLEAPVPILVSLNAAGPLDDGKVIRRLSYDHPLYTPETVAAQRRHGEISGARRVFFCGAYWGYGFHEDGVESAIAVARQVRDAARTSGRDDLNPERTEPLARHA